MNRGPRWIRFAGLALSLCAAGEVSAQPPRVNVADVVQTIETYYHSASAFRASFLQRYREGRQDVRFESGTAYFSRPGRMRWEYEAPEQKLFLTDGKNSWLYVPADRTATRAPMKGSADWRTPLALLTGKAKLSRFCGRIELAPAESGQAGGTTESAGQSAGHVALRCLPGRGASQPASKPQGSPPGPDNRGSRLHREDYFREILLEAKPASGELVRVLVVEPGGTEVEYRFAKWQRNPPLPEAMFHFQPLPGVAIVDDSALGLADAKH